MSGARALSSLAVVLALRDAAAGAPPAPPRDREVRGVVFRDDDGDGVRDPGEPPVADVVVLFETLRHARSAADGGFVLRAPAAAGVAWARTPDGFRPGPSWRAIAAEGDVAVELGLTPLPRGRRAEAVLVVGSDSHVGLAGIDEPAIARVLGAAARDADADLVALTGDLTQHGDPAELERVAALTAALPAFAPVPGNHDWYDGGLAYRARFGPPSYAFDVGDWHVVVLGWELDAAAAAAFVALDRSLGAARPTIALVHAPPEPALVAALSRAGVRAIFSGHQHVDRVVAHPGVAEYASPPLAMGGMDVSPAGFRVVRLGAREGGARVAVERRLFDDPRPPPGVRPTAPSRWRTPVGPTASGGLALDRGVLYVPLADPQGRSDGGVAALDVRDGRVRWTRALGAPVRATPALGGGLVVVTTLDGRLIALDADDGRLRWSVELAAGLPPHLRAASAPPLVAGDVVYAGLLRDFGAFELATGAPRWRTAPGSDGGDAPCLAGAALAGDLVLASFGRGFGGLHAFERATGAERWRAFDVAVGAEATPVVASDVALVVDWETRVSAVTLDDGAIRWRERLIGDADPWSYGVVAAPLLADGALVVPTMQGELVALDAATGARRWTTAAAPALLHLAHYPTAGGAFNTSPVAVADRLWTAGVDGLVRGLDRATGAEEVRYALDGPVLAAPVSDGADLFVATLAGEVLAIPLDGGATPVASAASRHPRPQGAPRPPFARFGGLAGGVIALIGLARAIAALRRRRQARARERERERRRGAGA